MLILLILLTLSFTFPNAFEKLKELYESTKTIKVSFVQKVKYEWYPKEDVSKGIFYASKGGKIRIDYYSPDRVSIFADRRKVVLVNYEEKTVYIESIKRNTSPVVASIFFLSEPPDKVFKPVGEFKEDDKTVLLLKPLKEDENVKEVKIYFSREGEILGLKTYDSQGSEISINFISVKRNYMPSSTLFVPRIPEGFKVLRYE
ncbi:MAG: outer membrane lipoprotein carrier protein LolA [Aquifex sp.]|nr:MAG: outer membrane lipoprotein carrier protein LolA [Aquifex sp.]